MLRLGVSWDSKRWRGYLLSSFRIGLETPEQKPWIILIGHKAIISNANQRSTPTLPRTALEKIGMVHNRATNSFGAFTGLVFKAWQAVTRAISCGCEACVWWEQ